MWFRGICASQTNKNSRELKISHISTLGTLLRLLSAPVDLNVVQTSRWYFCFCSHHSSSCYSAFALKTVSCRAPYFLILQK